MVVEFESALLTSDGALLASLVSPVHGVDVRLFRNGRIVNYDQGRAKLVFASTDPVDWGAAPGSGLEARGSFREVVLPELLDVFSKDCTLACNELVVGGTTYEASWPYQGVDFYSVHIPGSHAYGGLDWHTWLLGVHYVDAEPLLYAIMQFKWEP